MIKNITYSLVILVLMQYTFGMSNEVVYSKFIENVVSAKNVIVTCGTFFSFALIGAAYSVNKGILFAIMHKITFLCCVAARYMIYFFLVAILLCKTFLDSNLINDMGFIILFAPYIILFSSAWCLVVQDFNFPGKPIFIEGAVVLALSISAAALIDKIMLL